MAAALPRVELWQQGSRRLAFEFDLMNVTNNIYTIAKESKAAPLQYAMRRVVGGRLRVYFYPSVRARLSSAAS